MDVDIDRGIDTPLLLNVIILCIYRVSSKSQQNKMKLENISLIFGPTLMSNDQVSSY